MEVHADDLVLLVKTRLDDRILIDLDPHVLEFFRDA